MEYVRRKGQPLNRNEEHLFTQLEKMKDELNRPGQYNARTQELVTNVKANALNNEGIDYPALDKETIDKIQEVRSMVGIRFRCLLLDFGRLCQSADECSQGSESRLEIADDYRDEFQTVCD